MNLSLLLPLLFLAAIPCFSQITIEDYPRQIECQIDGTQDLEAPGASSSCGEVKSEISENIFSGGCLGTLVRTFHYTDLCGNTAKAEQYVSLKDNAAPVLIGVPGDISVSEKAIPLPSMVSARDNSGTDTKVDFSEKREAGFIIRTWSSTDPCHNTATGVQKIKLLKP
ncbi:MAG: hypothetical protein IT223_05440 [Crocinitomicaceae bacterium]|nr:hypothetical protein [Crocinitomicaceae bacterium]